MKKSFSLLEILLTIFLLTLIYSMFMPKNKLNNLDEITNRIELFITYTRFKALIDDKIDLEDPLWHKKRWTLKFFRCRESVGGIYYTIYSDQNKTGMPSANDSIKDPLTQKNIFTSNFCEENSTNSKYVLLTKKFDIVDVQISCNETTSLGQLSFGSNGKVYSKLSNNSYEHYEYEIKKPCFIKFIDKNGRNKEIIVNPDTGYPNKS